GIPGDNTYSNYQEANRVFWRQTVLPLAQRIGCSLAQWLAPAFGSGLRIAVDTDRIDALATDRAALWERVTNAPFLTLNEKREAVGYAPVEGGDKWEYRSIVAPAHAGTHTHRRPQFIAAAAPPAVT